MRASVVVVLVLSRFSLLTAEDNDECQSVVKNLTAEADVVLFDPGEVRGIKYNGSYKMCIFDPINEECLPAKRYDKYLLHHQNLVQHTWDETACEHDNMWLVNVRMLPPSMKLDEAFVIRVYNGTLVYMAQHCPRNSTVYAKWSPLLLLERPRPRNNTSKADVPTGFIIAPIGFLALLLIISVPGTAVITYCIMKRRNH